MVDEMQQIVAEFNSAADGGDSIVAGDAVTTPSAVGSSGTPAQPAAARLPLIILFSAPWCGPCKLLAKRLEATSAALDGGQRLRVLRVDVTASPGAEAYASRLAVRKLPTLLFVGGQRGRPAARTQGMMPDEVLRDVLYNKSRFAGDVLESAIRIVG